MVRIDNEGAMQRVQATPLYSQLSSVFRELITQEEWPKGKALPSEAELARRFGVSVGTTRKALEALESSGWVTRKQGRGTFVTDPAERQFGRFCRMVDRATGQSVFTTCVTTTLSLEVCLPSKQEADVLKIGSSDKVLHLSRRLDRKSAPFMLEKYSLQAAMLPDFEKLSKLPVNLYSILWQQYSIVVDRCEEHLQALAATPEVSQALHIRLEAPVLYAEQIAYDPNARVVASIQRWCDPNGVDYKVTLT